MIKSDEVTRKELINTIELFKIHPLSPGLAKKLIGYFHERMQEDEYVDSDLLYEFMKPVFASIMQGNTADQSFGFSPIRGKYERVDTFLRDLRAAAAVIYFHKRQDYSLPVSLDKAANLIGCISTSTANEAYKRYKNGLECLPDDVLNELVGMAR